ncbi:hypothetical protein [Listeria booriae]|uniref:Uncharacterized protein n=1 Tax=Listeria booriae TaxID=1552123 RepID=A0A7X0WGP5_9LIST|nr:hypothetical protein [Listeria booriae]MBC1333437.1 hypothetical protein [Listeria booriae]MBC2388743.1 hypothetical protein [Listeria booriae]
MLTAQQQAVYIQEKIQVKRQELNAKFAIPKSDKQWRLLEEEDFGKDYKALKMECDLCGKIVRYRLIMQNVDESEEILKTGRECVKKLIGLTLAKQRRYFQDVAQMDDSIELINQAVKKWAGEVELASQMEDNKTRSTFSPEEIVHKVRDLKAQNIDIIPRTLGFMLEDESGSNFTLQQLYYLEKSVLNIEYEIEKEKELRAKEQLKERRTIKRARPSADDLARKVKLIEEKIAWEERKNKELSPYEKTFHPEEILFLKEYLVDCGGVAHVFTVAKEMNRFAQEHLGIKRKAVHGRSGQNQEAERAIIGMNFAVDPHWLDGYRLDRISMRIIRK